jgi:hypothetical protein
MIVISNKSIECGYNIICNKVYNEKKSPKTNICNYNLSVVTNNKVNFTLIKKNYIYDLDANNLLFLYTFDPIKTAIEKDNNIKMLIYSILSVYMEIPEASIYLYTSESEKMNLIFKTYKILTLTIKQIDKIHLTRGCENKFAQIGHARIYLIPHLLETTKKNIIYMDNDTMIKNFGRSSILQMLKSLINPVGYILETYITLSEWIKLSSNIIDDNIIAEMCRGYYYHNTINNGILIFPNNNISLEFAKHVEKLYSYYETKYGYFYGLDMFIFSLLMHNYNFKFSNINSIIGSRALFHYYLFKVSLGKIVDQELTQYSSKNISI